MTCLKKNQNISDDRKAGEKLLTGGFPVRFGFITIKKAVILTFMFVCVLMVQGQKKVIFDDVLKPEKLYIEGSKVYILEEEVIKVFSLTDGKKRYHLTKRGEGPNEFKYGPALTFIPEYIVATGRGKVIFYQRDGKKIEEKRAPSDMEMFPVKSNYIGSMHVMDEKLQRPVMKVALYNADFQKLIDINTIVPESAVVISRSGKTPRQNYYMIPNGKEVVTDGSHICLYDSQKGFYMEIYDHEGKKISTIDKDYPKVKVSGAYKDREMEAMKKGKGWEQMKKMFEIVFPEYFPAFRRVFIDSGLLYVLTDTPKKVEQNLVVMDFTGKILARSKMPKLRCRYFQKGVLYYFKENEDEKWVLHIQKLL